MTIVGVPIILVVASPARAVTTAAQLVPVSLILPTALRIPSGSAAGLAGTVPAAAAPNCTTPDAVDGKFVRASGSLLSPCMAQVTPNSLARLSDISTMIASTCTCARRISNLSITELTVWSVLASALIIKALVPESAHIVTSPEEVPFAPGEPEN